MHLYGETKKYWDNEFSKYTHYKPFEVMEDEALERALEWLSTEAMTILDYGCGNGRILLRSLAFGVNRVLGIDLSEAAIKLATEVVKTENLKGPCEFIVGNVDALDDIRDGFFDGAILFNIIDQVIPDDGEKIIKEISKSLRTKGRVLLKLSPYYKPHLIEEDENYEYISNGFYRAKTGLFFRNLSKRELDTLLKPYFKIVKQDKIRTGEREAIERLYYLEKRL